MDKKYVMSLDEGTTSCRTILFDHDGNMVSVSQKEFTQYFPKPGWVEHDALEIWRCQMETAKEAMLKAGAAPGDIAGIGITNQRETAVVWERKTGKPVCNAIVWQCRRTADICEDLIRDGLKETIRDKTGLLIDPYFSATKLLWILDNIPGAREKAQAGELLFGTIDSWLIWNMTGGRVHVTDYSNAARTMLFNIHDLDWDDDILRILRIPRCMLPEPRESSSVYGYADAELFGEEIPISGAAGDQQCALFGQACFSPGEAKNTYGTGCFLLMNNGEKPVRSESGLVTTIAWGLDGKVSYALEGSVFSAGAAIQWLRDEMELLDNSAQSEELALKVPDTDGVYFVPAFTGLGAPYWDPYARGVVSGITRGTNRNHIVRAALESLAYQTCDVLSAMEKDGGMELSFLKVDGGASAIDFLMQFQADMMGKEVRRPVCLETTALGAAYLAGLSVSFWKDTEEIANKCDVYGSFSAGICREEREKKLAGWHGAVAKARL